MNPIRLWVEYYKLLNNLVGLFEDIKLDWVYLHDTPIPSVTATSTYSAKQPKFSQSFFKEEMFQPPDNLHGPKKKILGDSASAHCWLLSSLSSTTTPHSSSTGLLSIHSPPSLLFVLGIAPIQVQDLVLGLAELHQVPTAVGKDEARKPYKYDCLDSENVKPVTEIELKATQDGIPSLQCVTCTTQISATSKPRECLSPTVHVANEDVKQRWSQN
ncbi:hypothetical protein DUI87_05737 [Hirundo rustica rustica]|uniref:Uncharacterized protein n=1 Tax=Hirundo rustica rustica TaxID=333673 RepID=A0A3M0L2B1_HIRRU|nr:hypothetical protein DUI87_05737 [Hirundo rustica rustica]